MIRLLSENECHVYLGNSRSYLNSYSTFINELSTEERAKASSFRIERDKITYVVCHYWLRKILSELLQISMQNVMLTVEASAKPFLVNDLLSAEKSNVNFNISHSADYFVIAVNKNFQVGVDIEQFTTRADFADVVNNYFTNAEKQQWQLLDQMQKSRYFSEVWTQKEAIVKTSGLGVTAIKDAQLRGDYQLVSSGYMDCCYSICFHKSYALQEIIL